MIYDIVGLTIELAARRSATVEHAGQEVRPVLLREQLSLPKFV